MRSGRQGAAGSATETPGSEPSPITESDDPFKGRPGPTAGPGTPDGAPELSANGDGAEPLTERDAEAQVHGICFKTGPPGRIGVELEWLVLDGRDPALPVRAEQIAAALAHFGGSGGSGGSTPEDGTAGESGGS